MKTLTLLGLVIFTLSGMAINAIDASEGLTVEQARMLDVR